MYAHTVKYTNKTLKGIEWKVELKIINSGNTILKGLKIK